MGIKRISKDMGLAEGIVLNKPTRVNIREMLAVRSINEDDYLFSEALGLDSLLDSPLYRGGDHSQQSGSLWKNISWLHTLGQEIVPSARPLFPGLWDGGDLRELALLAQDGGAIPGRDFSFFFGSVIWPLEQPTSELARGLWARGRLPSDAHAANKIFFRSVVAPQPSPMSTSQGTPGETMWRGALRMLGLPALARFPRDRRSGMDEMLRELLGAELDPVQGQLLAFGGIYA